MHIINPLLFNNESARLNLEKSVEREFIVQDIELI